MDSVRSFVARIGAWQCMSYFLVVDCRRTSVIKNLESYQVDSCNRFWAMKPSTSSGVVSLGSWVSLKLSSKPFIRNYCTETYVWIMSHCSESSGIYTHRGGQEKKSLVTRDILHSCHIQYTPCFVTLSHIPFAYITLTIFWSWPTIVELKTLVTSADNPAFQSVNQKYTDYANDILKITHVDYRNTRQYNGPCVIFLLSYTN